MFIIEYPNLENIHKQNYFEGKEVKVRFQYQVLVGQNGIRSSVRYDEERGHRSCTEE